LQRPLFLSQAAAAFSSPPSALDRPESQVHLHYQPQHSKQRRPQVEAAAQCRTAAAAAATLVGQPASVMSAESEDHAASWKFLFDLTGFVVVRNVLTEQQVDAANRAVDAHSEREAKEGPPAGRLDMINMLSWDMQDRRPFLDMLAHPKLVPYLNCILGSGFRMDHAPAVLTNSPGENGKGMLHGSSGPGFDTNQYYLWKDGHMHNGLVVCAFQLSDVRAGDGGLGFVVRRAGWLVDCVPACLRARSHARQPVCCMCLRLICRPPHT
jgi:hypothetical protein